VVRDWQDLCTGTMESSGRLALANRNTHGKQLARILDRRAAVSLGLVWPVAGLGSDVQRLVGAFDVDAAKSTVTGFLET
jgi:hypothetical protein